MQDFVNAVKKSFDFKGRSRRREFWMFMLIASVLAAGLIIIETLLGLQLAQDIGILSTIYALAIAAPTASVTIRRLHDTGRSGWWSLLYLVPVIGWVALIAFTLFNSDLGANAYGKSPKAWNSVYTPINYY
ncbi:uncharacterized membrane protein YhaH (DUF805 family) [Planomicrobium koreense]|uniref:Uncharacterized membrane protein YhaH (DUF805 family) n=1 Tax=Planococcus koreensis TaxID=112331 RepID=A0A7W8CPJ4_9BACL|nr:DUF805 domain-containing protein [Planococcus koreensis]MBB5179262.1 uncharacterized membrane protein YhaH (DUF805 family) [Planococcus koreensis]